ncbi:hypothetical protein D9M70_614760 [compost metagenome]
MTEGLGQEQVRTHPAGAQRQHQQGVHGCWPLPEEWHQDTHQHSVEQPGEEVAGGCAVELADLARQQLVEAETQRRAERQQNRRSEQFAAGMDDDQHPDETQGNRQPLSQADSFAE